MKKIKNKKMENQVKLILHYHAALEEADASSKAASKNFVSAFIALAKDFGLTGENRSEFYSLFSDMKTDKKLAGRLKTAATRYVQYISLTGDYPTPETGLPQKGYGALKDFADKISAKSAKVDLPAEILPEDQIVRLFEGLPPDLQKKVLQTLQAIIKPAKAKPKKA